MSILSKLNPFKSRKPKLNLREMQVAFERALKNQKQHASYDAAAAGGDLASYWANADRFDADSAHSREIRHTMMTRMRYEIANNGYADGIAQTYATDLIGVGPLLRWQTQSQGFNQMVEREFYRWTQAVQFRRKLWCMAHAKHVDGEAFAIMRRNRRVNHPVKIDLCLYEAEQCQTPMLGPLEPGAIDGIEFDEFGNPTAYNFLEHHPGALHPVFELTPERVPADIVLHWFKMRRPGQHRGVPECASTMNLGAAFRRLREASLSTAEKVAAWTLLLKTLFEPEEIQGLPPLAEMPISHGMMTALPNSFDPVQLRAEQPGPQYEAFHRSLLNEQARPKNMPYNKAACDSASYNYSSGRLDHQTYYGNLDVDREDCNDQALEKLVNVWFDEAVQRFGWLGGKPEEISAGARAHKWDWPQHKVADIQAEASAKAEELKTGQRFINQLFTERGEDWDDEVQAAAAAYGVTPEEVRKRVFDILLPVAKEPAAPAVDEVEVAAKAYGVDPSDVRRVVLDLLAAGKSEKPARKDTAAAATEALFKLFDSRKGLNGHALNGATNGQV